jgi:iron complex transport system substrate-binding protein
MRIVSLLPSATEVVFALGLGNDLVGVSFECDFPAEAATRPVVSTSALPEGLDLAAIDAAVRDRVSAGRSVYLLDEDQVRALQPDVVLTQDTCRVCAVDEPTVVRTLQQAGIDAEVLSLDPRSLDDVIATIDRVAERCAPEPDHRGAEVTAALRTRLDDLRQRTAELPHPRVFVLEWADPPYTSGHWVPDLVSAAGGEPVLADPGADSHPISWGDVAAAEPDVVLVAPCGYGLADSLAQGRDPKVRTALAETPAGQSGSVWAIDSSSYVVRPGPRLVDGAETIAAILYPKVFGQPESARAARID